MGSVVPGHRLGRSVGRARARRCCQARVLLPRGLRTTIDAGRGVLQAAGQPGWVGAGVRLAFGEEGRCALDAQAIAFVHVEGDAAWTFLAQTSFEGRAGMLLESLCHESLRDPYPLPLIDTEPADSRTGAAPRFWLDPGPTIAGVLADLRSGKSQSTIATRFHAALIASTVEVASRVGVEFVALTGGCFQNRRLTEGCVTALQQKKFRVLLHDQVPANDGGLSLGQTVVARAGLMPGGL